MSEKTFTKGIFTEVKETKYGNIIKQSIRVDDFIPFLYANKNDKGYVNIDTLNGKNGKLYSVLNEYVPKEQYKPETQQPNLSESINANDSDLPF